MNFFVIIAVVILIGLIGYWMGQQAPGTDIAKAHLPRSRKRERQKQQVLELFNRQEKVTKDDAQKLLQVSDSNATRVLQDLVKDGEIEEHRETRDTYYTRR